MKIPANLPITAAQSRAARFQAGLTQANVIEESDLPGYKLKQFETGRFVPDMPFLEKLRDFYLSKGIELEADTPTRPDTPARQPGAAMVKPVSRMCFYLSDDLAGDDVNRLLERMDNNDNRIEALIVAKAGAGLLGGYDEKTEARVREIFGAMAENYLLFRMLQGRNIVKAKAGAQQDESETIGDIIANFYGKSPAVNTHGAPAASPSQPDEGDLDREQEGEE